MTVRVGIPRGLLYYEYFPLWQHFFTNLGAEVVQSPLSNKRLLALGLGNSVDETCLPVKLYMGHVAALIDVVDYLFVPRIVSIKNGDYHCPKFSGLPDMIRSVFANSPPILEAVVDRTENKGELLKSVLKTGRQFTGNPARIYAAYKQAVDHWRATNKQWRQSFLPQALTGNSNSLTVAVIGHSYNLYDGYGNNSLLAALTRLGVHILTSDNIDHRRVMCNAERYLPTLYWSMGKKLYGAAFEYAGQQAVDGIIFVMAFECGPDSLLIDLVNREITAHYHKPVMTLVLDEHTGEAGLMTRLEAFIDMIRRRP